jgi:dihydrofolate reductase
MRKLIASTFTSLDGVMQAPGGPNEDPSGGFTLGGWMFSFMDPEVDISSAGFDGTGRDLVLGRKTYEIFEAYWPYQAADNPIARSLNAAKKYVASRTLTAPAWHNSSLLGGDVVAALRALKAQPGNDLQIIGSGNLIQTLQAAALIDEYNVFTYPVVLGSGKRLFEAGARPGALRLVRATVAKSGVVMSLYVPAGDISVGTIGGGEPSTKEMARRAKWAAEENQR